MASYRIEKKWFRNQLQCLIALETESGRQALKDYIFKTLESGIDPKPESILVEYLDSGETNRIFGLKALEKWVLREETYKPPGYLLHNLVRLGNANYDQETEAYGRATLDFLIIACMLNYKDILSKLPNNQSKVLANDPTTTIAAPPTPLIAPESTLKSMKVFPRIDLSVRVVRGGETHIITGIADWAMGYGDRVELDELLILAIESKRTTFFSTDGAKLLSYLAATRQLRIQANKKNVMTQGFFSDGQFFRFMCIRHDGTVMASRVYDLYSADPIDEEDFISVFNSLLHMLITTAESSPNTSPTELGKERAERIENFDRDVFVEVFEDSRESDRIIWRDEESDGNPMPDEIMKE